jgi:predicted nucleotidyltransferase
MRLSQTEIDAIKKVTRMVFGKNSKTLLFGSRVDDNKRGGDIDLYIQYNPTIPEENLYRLKIKFLVQLKKIIGDQKIDVLIDTGKQTRNIFIAVKKEGIKI